MKNNKKINLDSLIKNSEVEKSPKRGEKKAELVNGKFATAIDEYFSLKEKIEAMEVELKEYRNIIEENSLSKMANQIASQGQRSTLKFETKAGNTCQFVLTDGYGKISFELENEFEEWKKDLEKIIGRGKAEEIVDDRVEFSITPEALEDAEIVKELEMLAKKIQMKHSKTLLKSKRIVEVKKGTVDKLQNYTNSAEDVRNLIEILKVIKQIRK